MSKPLRVLIVEDSEDDAELLVRELRRGGYEPEHARVDTVAAMKDALADGEWDVILADYNMPHFDAFAALKLSRESGRDLPFIIVSGTIGEDIAVEVMKAGAHDYLLKGNLARLLPAVERELREAEVRRARVLAGKALEERARQQAAVAELGLLGLRALAETELTALMDEAVSLIACTLDVELAKVLEMLPGGGSLLLRSGVGWRKGLVGRATVPASADSQAGFTLLSGGPVIVEDLAAETRFHGPPLLRQHRVISGVSVIIHGPERPFGVLGVHTVRQRTFSEDDIHFLQSVANVLATTIERVRMEGMLRESESRFRTTLDSLKEGFQVIGTDWRYLFVNDAVAQQGRRAKDELLGRTMMEVYPGIEDTEVFANLRRCLEERVPHRMQNEWVYADGDSAWFQLEIQPVAEGICVLSLDITERKQAEEALREREASLAEAQRIAHLGNWDWDIVANELRWSDEIYRIFGLAPQEFGATYEAFLNSVHPDDREFVSRCVDEALYESKPYSIDHRIVLPDGSERVVHEQAEVSRDAEGKPIRMVGTVHDITERERAEEALRLNEERFSTTLSSIGDAVIATDTAGGVTFLNPAAQSLTGWSQEEAVGRPLGDVFKVINEETGEPIDDPVTRVMQEGIVVGLANQTALVTRDGSRRAIEDSGAPIRGQDGNITGVVLVFHDVSERRWAADELRRLTARLLEVQEDDRRQVAYDIHDGLGQMMTAASMHLEAFAGRRDAEDVAGADEEFAKARRCLQEAVVEMRRMVSELGPLLLEDMGLVEASRRLLSDMAERIGWETEFESEGMDERLDGMAETALFRIVQEALANVAKHAGSQKVAVSFTRRRDTVRLEVRDWGAGFALNGLPDKPGRGRHVGLVGMRERAALIGGEMSVESSPGDGTSVVVKVPVAPVAARLIGKKKAEVVRMTEATKVQESSRDAITVLIADDHPMVREGLRSMLDAQGIEVIGEAVNGADAVEQTRNASPDVVLMDVRMPDMDGLAATEIIKQSSPQTSVVVITSYESKEYLRRAIEAGAAGYLLKGMSRESLIDAVRLVRGGGSLIDARLLSELLKEMGVEGSRFRGVEGALEALTPREQEVLNLLVRGLTNKEIASEMHYSVGTVKNVVQRVIEKLGVSDRTQAAVYAVRAGVNPPT